MRSRPACLRRNVRIPFDLTFLKPETVAKVYARPGPTATKRFGTIRRWSAHLSQHTAPWHRPAVRSMIMNHAYLMMALGRHRPHTKGMYMRNRLGGGCCDIRARCGCDTCRCPRPTAAACPCARTPRCPRRNSGAACHVGSGAGGLRSRRRHGAHEPRQRRRHCQCGICHRQRRRCGDRYRRQRPRGPPPAGRDPCADPQADPLRDQHARASRPCLRQCSIPARGSGVRGPPQSAARAWGARTVLPRHIPPFDGGGTHGGDDDRPAGTTGGATR